ncbi:MAG: lysophospholipid acyltransferase family protein [Deltaproteobacteria bacterium]|nr:lysophospholipid acyltransferase family protein [Deltaproteobacteria bacterium]
MTYRILYLMLYLIAYIPRPVGLRLGESLGWVLYRILKQKREAALNNLTIALGDRLGAKEGQALVKKSFQFLGRHFFEVCYLIRFDKEKLASYLEFKGVHHFEQARAQNKGVVLLTGHFGCWELMAVGIGYFISSVYLVTMSMKFKPVEELVRTLRGVSGNQSIPKEKSMRRLIQILKQGDPIGILLDQNVDWYEGVFVPFFNKRACTNKGLALLVRKTQVPVVPVFIVHQGGGRHRIEFQPALPWLSFGDRTKEIEENTAQYNQVIEAMARQYPDHYFWVHQRWKTRPYQAWPRQQD